MRLSPLQVSSLNNFWLSGLSNMNLRFLLLLSLFFPNVAYAAEEHLQDYAIRNTHYVLFLRHALAPGHGDPSFFSLKDCRTQRNLNEIGRQQSKRVGRLIQKTGVIFKKVYSSEWCRCRETAALLDLGSVIPLSALNSFYQGLAPKKKTLGDLKRFLKTLNKNDLPILMVTHFVTINAITGMSLQSGGAVAFSLTDGKSTLIAFNGSIDGPIKAH